MRLIRTLLLLLMAISPFLAISAMALFLATAVLAQDRDTTVGLGTWWVVIEPYVVTVISSVVLAIIGWFTAIVQQYLGIKIEEKHRLALHSALMSGVAAALTKFRITASAARLDVGSKVIAEAILWAERSVPDAIKHLGLNKPGGEDKMAELAAAKLSLLAEAPSGTAQPSADKPNA